MVDGQRGANEKRAGHCETGGARRNLVGSGHRICQDGAVTVRDGEPKAHVRWKGQAASTIT